MNLQNVFPDIPGPVWDDLASLAASDWVEAEPDPKTGYARFMFYFERIADPVARAYAEAAAGGAFTAYGGPSKAALWLYAVSRLLADGPKVFRATAEQCEAMEHVDLSLTLGEYRQAYPTMLVEFPREYVESVARRAGALAPHPPRFVLVHHWPGRAIFTGCSITDIHGVDSELVFLFGGESAQRSLEEAIRIEYNPDPQECFVNEALTRVSLNLMLLLARATTRVVPSDPAGLDRARRQLAKGVKPDVQRRDIARHVHLVVPNREVVVRKVRRVGAPTDASPPAGDRSVSTHWVRGHHRALPGYAAARHRGEAVPLLFVNPYLVVGAGPDGPAPAPAFTVQE